MPPRNTQEDERPSVAAETRAWIAVGTVLVAHAIGGIWWAASLSAELKFLRELMSELRSQIGTAYTSAEARRDREVLEAKIHDHENRLRGLERGNNQQGGGR